MAQTKIGWRPYVATTTVTESSLWNSIYSVYNADAVGSSSLKTSLFAAYNGESNANDSFGTNNGTAQGGLTYTAGKIGNAFNFNGTNAYVQLGDVMDIGTSSWSYSMWFNANQLTAGTYLVLFSKSIAASGSGRVWATTYGNQLQFNFDAAGNSNNINTQTTLTFNTNTWYHVVCVLDRNDKLKMYVNGTLVTLNTILGDNNLIPFSSVNYNTNNPFRIGTYTAADNASILGTFNGKIDAFNVWQKALTQSEITELYNSGNGAQYITDSFYKPTTNDALNTYNGTAVGGLTYEVGKVGTAFKFNGSNSYVYLPENSIRFTNSFSTSFWLKTTVNQTGGGGLISDYYYNSDNYGYFIYLRTDNKISVHWKKDLTWNGVVSSSALSLNQWNYISVVWDKVNTNWKIYINGVLDNQLTSINASNITYAVGSNRTNIGSINSYGPDCLNGSMDSINFWNKTLTQSEITELYNSGNGKQYPN